MHPPRWRQHAHRSRRQTQHAGALDADELLTAFTLLGYKVRPRDLEALMAEIDPDGSGQIEFDEFASIMGRTINAGAPEPSSKALIASSPKVLLLL